MRRLLIACALALLPTLGQADPATILADAAQMCADQDKGVFTSDGAVKELDLTGDGKADTLVDEGLFRCSNAASLYGGSGGSLIHIFANGTESSYLVQGWDTAKWNNSLLVLLALHGSNCNAIGAQPCYEALTWGETGFLSVRAQTP